MHLQLHEPAMQCLLHKFVLQTIIRSFLKSKILILWNWIWYSHPHFVCIHVRRLKFYFEQHNPPSFAVPVKMDVIGKPCLTHSVPGIKQLPPMLWHFITNEYLMLIITQWISWKQKHSLEANSLTCDFLLVGSQVKVTCEKCRSNCFYPGLALLCNCFLNLFHSLSTQKKIKGQN